MKKKLNIYIVSVASAILAMSCDQKNAVVALKNKTDQVIIGVELIDDSLTDSDLYKDQVGMNIYIEPGKFQDIGAFNFRFGEKSDTSKICLYMFYNDSLSKYRKLKMTNGILAN